MPRIGDAFLMLIFRWFSLPLWIYELLASMEVAVWAVAWLLLSWRVAWCGGQSTERWSLRDHSLNPGLSAYSVLLDKSHKHSWVSFSSPVKWELSCRFYWLFGSLWVGNTHPVAAVWQAYPFLCEMPSPTSFSAGIFFHFSFFSLSCQSVDLPTWLNWVIFLKCDC